MPISDLAMLERLADRISAVERLQAIKDRSVSSGYAKKQTVDRHLAELNERAQGIRDRRIEKGAAVSLTSVRAAGIAVKVQPKRAEHG